MTAKPFTAEQIATGDRLLRETGLPSWAIADACDVAREDRDDFIRAIALVDRERGFRSPWHKAECAR